jgi:Na+-transporting NADH:ubiquinone oxidoreductase subunit NqrB
MLKVFRGVSILCIGWKASWRRWTVVMTGIWLSIFVFIFILCVDEVLRAVHLFS